MDVTTIGPDLKAGEIEEFVSACCVVGPNLHESDTLLRSHYFSWCSLEGREACSPEVFVEALASLYPETRRSGARVGLRLKTATEAKFPVRFPTF